ncbi:MAG TPA: amidase [Alphaproteobacteria bacterium]|nr:amidase [Alphaproteobacteria bacterium]
MAKDDASLLSATEMVAQFRSGSLSPVEATKAALDRIERLNSRFNAFCLVDAEGALAAARTSEGRWRQHAPLGPVDGVPATVKDLVLAKGWPTRRGSKTTTADPAPENAPAVARLRESGAVLLGKTTTPEFGWKGVTDSPLTGITRNPWDDSRTPGGSSGGAAVAAALGMGALHIGTDGGGSIRIPASFTGIFGFKASFGRVPAWPPSPFASVAHLGPMTRTVGDAALMLNAITRPDHRDWYALPQDRRDWRDGLEEGVRGLKIAYAPRIGQTPVEPEVAAAVAVAARRFEELGANVEEAIPALGEVGPIFAAHWFPAAALLIDSIAPEKRTLMDPGLLAIGEQGARMTLLDHLKAVRAREAMGLAMQEFHSRYDLLLLPTMPLPAFAAGEETPVDSANRRWTDWTPFTYPFNLTRQPAASVPCAFTKAGLPIGLQIVGRLYDDATVLKAARAFERLQPFPMPKV